MVKKNRSLRILIGSYLLIMFGLPLFALINHANNATSTEFFQKAFNPIALSAYWVTLSTAFTAAIINGFFGLLVAWILVRFEFKGKKFIDATIDLPFALPTAVAGLTITTVYSDQTILGSFFNHLGIEILFTRTGVGLAMVFVSFPFVVRSVQPILQELQQEIEEASWSLGASSIETFFKVIFPAVFPSLITGMTLAFSRAMGEYGSIVIVASNIPFRDLVASVLIFQSLEQYDKMGATVIGTVVLMISLILLFTINALQNWQKL
uniref:Sulfate transport system permease protein CysT n=1 Tax=Marsupiomonas sp. NIES 1824 TaxID=1562198 RepID=A0A097KLU5_9CHLO|nr:probable transport protein [Marsupiomonas sp. NIES 1824]